MPPIVSSLNATWLHGHRRPAWVDLDRVDQLFIMSCFVNREGWADIAGSLTRLLTAEPAAEIRLYLSLEGTTSVGRSQLYEDLIAFFGHHRTRVVGERPPLQLFLVRDQYGRLFHPKAYALRAGGRFAVSVGSANITGAAHRSNHEMELMRDDPETYKEFVAAAQALERSALTRRFKVPTDEKLRDYLGDHERRRRAFTRTLGSLSREPALDRENAFDSALEDAPEAPISIDLAASLSEIQRAITVGCRLIEQDFGLPNLSVSLRPFVTAGIIANPPQRTLLPGIKLGDGSVHAVLISLVPDPVIEAMKLINRRQGFLLRQFSIDLLGVRWMPVDWESAFLRNWTLCRTQAGLPHVEVDHHLDQIQSDLTGSEFVDRLAQGLTLELNTARWNAKAATRLLMSSDLVDQLQRGNTLSGSMKMVVFAEIATYIRRFVMGKLDRDAVRFQVERVGVPPRCDEMPRSSFHDALDFVATVSAIVTQDVLADEDMPNREDLPRNGGTGVRRALVSFTRREPRLQAPLREYVLKLRRCLTDRAPVAQVEIDQLLISAWQALKGIFVHSEFPQNWTAAVPNWDPSWKSEAPSLVQMSLLDLEP